MKKFKINIAQAIVEEFNRGSMIDFPPVGTTDRAVKFSDIAQRLGYNHIDRADIEDIIKQVTKISPALHAVRVVKDPNRVNAAESRWSTTYITDLEFDA